MADQRAQLEQSIREQYSGSNELSDEEVQRIADLVESKLNAQDGAVHALAREMREGKAAQEMRQLHVAGGIRGGLALLEGVVRACPGFTARRREHLLRSVAMPDGIQRDHYGGVPVEFPAGRGEDEGERNRAHKFYLRCDAVAPDHDFAAELAKLRPFVADEAEGKQIEEMLGALLLQARHAFIALLDANPELERTLLDKFRQRQADFSLRRFHAGENKTLYFREPAGANAAPQKIGPCAGLLVETA